MEIPFLDGKEGACGFTLTKKTRIVPNQNWESQRPYMLMIHADYWSEIRKKWRQACRYAKDESACNVQLESVDTMIRSLDDLVSKIGAMK